MKRNRVLSAVSGVLAVAGVLASLPVTANAATKYYPTKIEINNNDTANPGHLVASDPFAGQNNEPTSYLPIWYVDQALTKLGITPSWNGAEGVLSLTVPSTMQVNYPTPPTPMAIDSQIMKIEVNGQVVTYAPRLAAVDEGTTTETTYVPIYYLEKTLKAIGITVGWDGTDWTMDYTATAPSAPTTPSGDVKLAAALAFAQTLGIKPNPDAGNDPYTDIPGSDWPTLSVLLTPFDFQVPGGGGANFEVGSSMFQPESSTTFGSTVSASDIDRAFQVYSGIPTGHDQYLPGGSVTSFGEILGLSAGVPTTGNLSQSDVSTMMENLARIEKGDVALGNGQYQLVYRPGSAPNYWQTSIPASVYSQDWANAIKTVDAVKIQHSNGVFTTTVPAYTDAGYDKTTGNYIGLTGISAGEQYSLDGGKTWRSTTGVNGYNSLDPKNGGVSAVSDTSVLIRDKNGGGVAVSYVYNGQPQGFVVGGLAYENGQLIPAFQ
ncbi:hypothetical protein [Alicyclobacillus fodiniaquatilis]|uniref:Copper amine oxidase-like N-terminal domain-containing protein n=1 Tax=Alicyclobacillus fodiniaquatilis TaxID=1661150 RepID=A0ABW4JLW2_9BACL